MRRAAKPRLLGLLGFLLLVLPLGEAASGQPGPAGDSVPVYGYRVVASHPHDPEAFTQGLVYHDGYLYESTGRDSELRKVRLQTGEVVRRVVLADRYFGEGLTIWRDRLIQLTWQSNVGFVYGLDGFRLRNTFSYPGEGWGLTHDGESLIMSDGSSQLRFLDPETFEEQRRVRVMNGTEPVDKLNELEYVRGEIYANVYQTAKIVRIAPDTGRVVGWIDLRDLGEADSGRGVLNGIAFDPRNDRLFVTGKLWPRLFQIELVPR